MIGYATVSDSDFNRLSRFRWWGYEDGQNRYARRTEGRKTFLLHQAVKPGPEVHHRDSDGWNNQRGNLIPLTRAQHSNFLRRKKSGHASSRYVGVHWHRQHKKWCAEIKVSGVKRHLGLFKSELQASRVYRKEKRIVCGF